MTFLFALLLGALSYLHGGAGVSSTYGSVVDARGATLNSTYGSVVDSRGATSNSTYGSVVDVGSARLH